MPETTGAEPRRRPAFVTTHWSVVLAAGRSQTTQARAALAELCQTYWYPLYVYVRRRGYNPHDAQDLTQAFFARLLERQSLASADPERGRFRSFMLASMNHFLASEWEKVRAETDGGRKSAVAAGKFCRWTSLPRSSDSILNPPALTLRTNCSIGSGQLRCWIKSSICWKTNTVANGKRTCSMRSNEH